MKVKGFMSGEHFWFALSKISLGYPLWILITFRHGIRIPEMIRREYTSEHQ